MGQKGGKKKGKKWGKKNPPCGGSFMQLVSVKYLYTWP
jgi:hypothetical protein